MTELRDDGYLSTDDPVVQACFLGKPVYIQDSGPFLLEWIGQQEVGVPCTLKSGPILIPASVVAEVFDKAGESGNHIVPLVLGAIGMYEHPQFGVLDWLRQHTGEES